MQKRLALCCPCCGGDGSGGVITGGCLCPASCSRPPIPPFLVEPVGKFSLTLAASGPHSGSKAKVLLSAKFPNGRGISAMPTLLGAWPGSFSGGHMHYLSNPLTSFSSHPPSAPPTLTPSALVIKLKTGKPRIAILAACLHPWHPSPGVGRLSYPPKEKDLK